MMIGHLIKCKKCGEELQPENLLVGTSPDGKLTRKCGFCGFEEVVEKERDLKTFRDLRIEEELCEKLDLEVYLPVKGELEGIDRTYSLGARKEDFKGFIEKKFKELRQEAIKRIKHYKGILEILPEYFKKYSHRDKEGKELPIEAMEGFYKGKIEELEEFLNITEEDLK